MQSTTNVKDIVSVFGGSKYLGQKVKDRIAFDHLIREGFTLNAGAHLREVIRLTEREFAGLLGINIRTFARKKKQEVRLSPVASDRLFRLARIFAFAMEVLGSTEQAREWLHTPQIGLGERTPLDMIKTEAGAQEVEDLLGRIEHGVAL